MLALLLALAPALQEAAPTAFEAELSILAVVGEGARGALWSG